MSNTPLNEAATPSLLLTEGTTPSTPATGKWRVFVRSSDGHVCKVDDAGAVVDLEPISGGGGGSSTITGVILSPQGRLALTSGTPTPASATGATTVYYTPAVGGFVPIYDGSAWNSMSFAELSQTLADTTKSPAAAAAYGTYDVFVWNDGGTLRATRGPVWTQAQTFTVTIASPAVFSATGHGLTEGMPVVFSTTIALPTGLTAGTTYFVIAAGLTADAFEVSTSLGGAAVNTSGTQSGTHTVTQHNTVRGTGAGTSELHYLNGIQTNANAITNGPAADRGTYVGTFRTSATNTVEDTLTQRFVWNAYNRRERALYKTDGTASWNYTLNAWRPFNGSFANAIEYVSGSSSMPIDVTVKTGSVNSNATSVTRGVAVGVDSSVTPSGVISTTAGGASSIRDDHTARYSGVPGLGYHIIWPIEASAATGTTTWAGTLSLGGTTSPTNGIFGTLEN